MFFAFTLISIFTTYSISRKLGMKGWELFVPGYNLYKIVEVATGNGWLCFLFLLVLIPFAGFVIVIILLIVWGIKFSRILAEKYGAKTAAVFFVGLFYMPYYAFKDAPNCEDPFNKFVTKFFTLNKENTKKEEKIVLPEI